MTTCAYFSLKKNELKLKKIDWISLDVIGFNVTLNEEADASDIEAILHAIGTRIW